MLLKGKNAIITGSNQGFGKEIARKFLEEGANVLICGRTHSKLEESYAELNKITFKNQKLYSMTLDISNSEDIQAFHGYTVELFNNKIDILINNAGIYGVKGLVDSKDFELWKETIDINLLGTVNMCMVFLPELKKSKGKVINIIGGGSMYPRKFFSAYSTSKAGVVRFSECLAEELREYEVDVNCISPGALNTRLLDEAISDGIEKVGIEYYTKALKQKLNGGDSLENGTKLCVFLASEKSNHITGKSISAVWDEWEDLPNHIKELNCSDIYTLRRKIPNDISNEWSGYI